MRVTIITPVGIVPPWLEQPIVILPMPPGYEEPAAGQALAGVDLIV